MLIRGQSLRAEAAAGGRVFSSPCGFPLLAACPEWRSVGLTRHVTSRTFPALSAFSLAAKLENVFHTHCLHLLPPLSVIHPNLPFTPIKPVRELSLSYRGLLFSALSSTAQQRLTLLFCILLLKSILLKISDLKTFY